LEHLSRKRQEHAFSTFYKETQEHSAAKDLVDAPCLPRQRRIPRRLDEGNSESQHAYSDAESYFRQSYFEGLDRVSQEIRRRIDQKNFGMVRQIEQLITDSASGKPVEIPDAIRELYGKNLDFGHLSVELEMLRSAVAHESGDPSVATVIEVVKKNPILSETRKLIKLYLTIPVTTATAERTFSALKRVHTYLRATMTQERLNGCMIMHVFPSRVAALDLNEIANDFVRGNPRREHFFGHFQ
jgi:hypothetical protein